MGLVQNLTEGGQTWAHRVRMLRQVIKLICSFSLVIGILVFSFGLLKVPKYLYEGTWHYAKAHVAQNFYKTISVDEDFWAFAAHERLSSKNNAISTQRVISVTSKYAKQLSSIALSQLYIASNVMTISTFATLLFFLIRGSSTKGKKHISGSKKQWPLWLAFKINFFRKASDIKIGSVPLIKGTETRHMIITGGTGSGKTNCLHHLLKQIQVAKNKTIIIDTTGTFVDRYYRPGKDHILNPFHQDTVQWHPWIECKTYYDYSALAEAFIPQSYSESENYWRQAARTLFTSLLYKFEDQKQTSEILQWSLYEPLSKLCSLLEGTKAAAHMDIKSEKTAGSIRSVASSFLGCLEFLKDTENSFSIKKWIQDDSDDSWLFLHSAPSQRAALTPLLTAWISIAIRSILEMPPSFSRRIWYVLDELPNLNRVKDLETLVSEGRKYGACGILAMQSPSQLESIYGKSLSQTIAGNCATKVVFSEYDPEMALGISKAFGQREIQEYQEGLTYGAHDVRDGVNLSYQKTQVPVITPTEIQSLKKNTAYLRVPDFNDTVKIKLKIVD